MMFSRLATLLGIPTVVDAVRDRVERLVADVSAAAKEEGRFAGVVAAIGLAAAAAGFVTFVALVVAIVSLVDRQWGHDAALLASVLIPGLVTVVLIVVAYNKVAGRPKSRPALSSAFADLARPAARPEPRTPRPEPAAMPRFSASPAFHGSASANAEVRTMLEGANFGIGAS